MNVYIQQINAHNENIARNTGRRLRYFVRTYGCQMNVRESEHLTGVLTAMGYSPAPSEKEADLVLYNTCCVRENAENKVFGNLGYLKYQKTSNQELTIVVCGCMVQQDVVIQQIRKHHEYIDVVFGTTNHNRFPEFLWRHIETGQTVADLSSSIDGSTDPAFDATLAVTRGHVHKAGVNVMYGCNNFCSYCIVPYVRGRERSRSSQDILEEARALADDGVKEIMLLGQNVNAYGVGLKETISFAGLLRRMNEISSLARIRFMTSHPKDFSEDLISAVLDCDKVCKHIHLPMQSGSTRILEAMNRHYTRKDYMALTKRITNAIPGVSITTDIIVGFPGETESDFLDTLDMVRNVGFSGVFTFLYSKRTGTPAAEAGDTVPTEVAEERFKRLLNVVNPMLLQRNESRIGQVLTVMAEDGGLSRNGTYTGRADDNTLVHFSGDPGDPVQPVNPGDLVNVTITDCKTFYLTGCRQ